MNPPLGVKRSVKFARFNVAIMAENNIPITDREANTPNGALIIRKESLLSRPCNLLKRATVGSGGTSLVLTAVGSRS